MTDRVYDDVGEGWTDDVDERRARRPEQVIEDGNMTSRISPAWRYECTECGTERRFASEATYANYHCDECGELQMFKPRGRLVYPSEDDDE